MLLRVLSPKHDDAKETLKEVVFKLFILPIDKVNVIVAFI